MSESPWAEKLSSQSDEHKERMRRQAATEMAQEGRSDAFTSISKPIGGILGTIIGTYFGGAAGGKIGASAGTKAGSGFGKLAAGDDAGESLQEALVPDKSTLEAFGMAAGDEIAGAAAKDGAKGADEAKKAGAKFNAVPKAVK